MLIRSAKEPNALALADRLREEVCGRLDGGSRSRLGQFLTPPSVGRYLAGQFQGYGEHIRFLDAGAGLGSLSAAFVERLLSLRSKPKSLHIEAWEIEPAFLPGLQLVLDDCLEMASGMGIRATCEIHARDFLQDAALIADGLFSKRERFTHCAINPPYGKIATNSDARRILRRAGLETTNLYAGFVWMASRLLTAGGEMAAITPRSFCNGPYFQPFREAFLSFMALRHVTLFEKRDELFADDQVLQETIVFHAIRGSPNCELRISNWRSAAEIETHLVRHGTVVSPSDPQRVIHLPAGNEDLEVSKTADCLTSSLEDLGIQVSTGRVVDFRSKDFLRSEPSVDTVPLLYPGHLKSGRVVWPIPASKKANAIVASIETEGLLVPNGVYVLVKRFSAKEERKRIVAALFEPISSPARYNRVGFENHLNYFHMNGRPLEKALATGLALFLNSTLVDRLFRQFNGHTQVNASDLRRLRYPTAPELRILAASASEGAVDQDEIDETLARTLSLRVEAA